LWEKRRKDKSLNVSTGIQVTAGRIPRASAEGNLGKSTLAREIH
jgi:hypothetical protein